MINEKPQSAIIHLPFTSRDDFIKGKKDIRLHRRKTFQIKLFTFLDRPSGWKCLLYHLFVFMIVLATLIISALETVQHVSWSFRSLYILEIILVIIFSIEFILRIWSAGSHISYLYFRGRIRYLLRPINVIDLLIVSASIYSLVIETRSSMFNASAVKWLRIIQILRIIRMDRRGSSWSLVCSVVSKHKEELVTSLYIGFFLLLVMSYLVYVAENYHAPSKQFRSLLESLYWGIITATTVGYGDIAPVTSFGKALAGCLSIVTISFFALPAGILATGFALRVQQKQREKKYSQQIPAAATLIQTLWRLKCTHSSSESNATWRYYASMIATHRQKVLHAKMAAKQQENTRNIAVLATLRKKMESIKQTKRGYSYDTDNYQLTNKQIEQIKVICRMEFITAVSKFKKVRNPFDVEDVIEQGHLHLMMKIRELQRKIDSNNSQGSDSNSSKNSQTVSDAIERLDARISSMESILLQLVAAITNDQDLLSRLESRVDVVDDGSITGSTEYSSNFGSLEEIPQDDYTRR